MLADMSKELAVHKWLQAAVLLYWDLFIQVLYIFVGFFYVQLFIVI